MVGNGSFKVITNRTSGLGDAILGRSEIRGPNGTKYQLDQVENLSRSRSTSNTVQVEKQEG